jgi:hypothetical protein
MSGYTPGGCIYTTMHKEFAVHKVNEEGFRKANDIAAVFSNTLNYLESVCPAGRELAIVRTKLEEACFFAKKSMASQPENQDGEVKS